MPMSVTAHPCDVLGRSTCVSLRKVTSYTSAIKSETCHNQQIYATKVKRRSLQAMDGYQHIITRLHSDTIPKVKRRPVF